MGIDFIFLTTTHGMQNYEAEKHLMESDIADIADSYFNWKGSEYRRT